MPIIASGAMCMHNEGDACACAGALMLLGQQAAFHKEDGHVDKACPLLQRSVNLSVSQLVIQSLTPLPAT